MPDTKKRGVCACGHSWNKHEGYVRGPNVDEWCEGAGWHEDPVVGEDGEPMGIGYWLCTCREYDGPLPEGEDDG